MAKVQPIGVDIPKIQETQEEEDEAQWEISSTILEGEKAAKWSGKLAVLHSPFSQGFPSI